MYPSTFTKMCIYLSTIFTNILKYFVLLCGLLSDTSDNSVQRKCAHFAHSSSSPFPLQSLSHPHFLSMRKWVRTREKRGSDSISNEGGMCGVLSAKIFFSLSWILPWYLVFYCCCQWCCCAHAKHSSTSSKHWLTHSIKSHRDEKSQPDLCTSQQPEAAKRSKNMQSAKLFVKNVLKYFIGNLLGGKEGKKLRLKQIRIMEI